MHMFGIYVFLAAGIEAGTNGEDLMTLEAEISELHRENARVESQMLKLKNDINVMETHLNQGDKARTIVFIRFYD